jgi:hypothetical protein
VSSVDQTTNSRNGSENSPSNQSRNRSSPLKPGLVKALLVLDLYRDEMKRRHSVRLAMFDPDDRELMQIERNGEAAATDAIRFRLEAALKELK